MALISPRTTYSIILEDIYNFKKKLTIVQLTG